MSMLKRMQALALAAVMGAAMLAGCTGGGQQTQGSSQESGSGGGDTAAEAPALASVYPEFSQHREVNITWFEQGWTGPVEDLDFVVGEIEKRTNLKMNYEAMVVPSEQDYTQKLNLMVAANEVPDIFFGGIDLYTRTIYEKLGQSGSLWDFKDLVPQYENLNDLVQPEMNLYRTEDDKNYFVPTQTGRGYEVLNEPPHGLFIRQDFLDQLGMEYPTNPEEFYEYLKRATSELTVNGQPVKGLLLGENADGINHMIEMFYPLIGDRETYQLPFDVKNDYAVVNYDFTDSPELLEASKYVNRLSREGLLDSEVLAIKAAQFQEKGSSGQYAAMTASWWDMNIFADNAKAEVPDIFWVCPPPMYASETIRQSRNQPWTNWVGCYSSLIANSSNDEETLRHLLAVMDYFCLEEGQLLIQAGVEGVSFQWNDDGKYEYTQQFIEDTNDLDWNKASAYGVLYYAQMVNNTPAIAHLQATPPALLRPDNYQGWVNQQIKRDAYQKDMELTLDYYFLAGEVQSEKLQPIKDQRTSFFAQILTAKSEEEIEKIVAQWGDTCRSMGIDEIVAERAAIMDEIKAEMAS